jgi:hypothetical protein
MFTASNYPKRVNEDGSRNVYCLRCRNFICTASQYTAINTALCVVCQADDEGIDLTAEQVRELRGVRVGNYTLSEAAAFPDKGIDPMTAVTTDQITSTVGRIGYFIKALVKSVVIAAVDTVKEQKVYSSKEIAKENKRKRLFDLDVDK